MVISFVGAGRLATNLALSLQEAGHTVRQVWSRTEQSAQALARQLGCDWCTDIAQLRADVDVLIFSVKDSALEALAGRVKTDALCLHTAGSMPLEALPQPRRGVLYPMQTFSKERGADFRRIPVFLEAEGEAERKTLWQLACSLSDDVRFLSAAQRRALHMAAVFACNFANRCYDIAAELLGSQGIPFQTMLPLIDETAGKVHQMSPREAQTGPAIRWDENVIQKHLKQLDGLNRDIYELMSRSIHERQKQDSKQQPA